jgi:hypothetical protein
MVKAGSNGVWQRRREDEEEGERDMIALMVIAEG